MRRPDTRAAVASPRDGWYHGPFAFPGKRRVSPLDEDNQSSFLGRSAKSLQVNVRAADSAAMVSYTLIGAIVVLGGIGFGLDRWLNTSPWCLFGGLVLGLIVGFYELAKAVFWRQ